MLKGKVAVVTGASRGIGRAIALKYAENGADLAVLYNSGTEAAKEVVREAEAMGVSADAYACNVADFEAAGNSVRQIYSKFGGIDILVNNAGVTADNLLLRMSEDEFAKVLDISLKGAFNMIRHAAREMVRRRGGRIINITSVAGLSGNAGQANYSAAKAGLIGLTKAAAKEFAGRGITCNAIAPGLIDTDMTAVLPDKVKENYLQSIPLGRMGRPEEVAALALYLSLDAAAYITGEVIRIDGGLCI